ncbi:very short patch repair endonuclease [Mumia sp. ZJ1417]|uniref:very short patch repair endonuclease n=1 Tax=Mumia sp. ZJ1417 TaxID=2708082 RepID=UPI00141E0A2F|nr:very short patch repair endonuclease [Mumia sp. ZJ1417]QMW64920.1 very short patch repair endonuclease [Mumia sp. ZJ1417]
MTYGCPVGGTGEFTTRARGPARRAESWASTPAVRRSMLSNRSRDTKPEIAVRRLVHAAGLRYRVDFRPLAGLNRRADIVFPGLKIAIFIDGCFWHGCPEHHTVAESNGEYWASKVTRNRARDRETDHALESYDWLVLRAWEHEPAEEVAQRVIDAVQARRTNAFSRRP